jgi:endogenous inhibitor of DNA gyrase (YacG/DUF329 family)
MPPRDAECVICGSRFTTHNPYRKYCSKKCRLAAWHAAHPDYVWPKSPRRGTVSKCKFCAKPFKEWHASRRSLFCSTSCVSKYGWANGRMTPTPCGMRIHKKCEWCGKMFERPPSTAGRFCSNHCKGLWMLSFTAPKKCAECGIEFETKRHLAGRAKYCSPKCSAAVAKRARKRHPKVSKLMQGREKICAACGYDSHPEILHIHHKDRDRSNNVDTNLEYLCPNCHALVHRAIKSGVNS